MATINSIRLFPTVQFMQGEREVRPLAKRAAFLCRSVQCGHGDVLTLGDSELLMQGTDLGDGLFYPVLWHNSAFSTKRLRAQP